MWEKKCLSIAAYTSLKIIHIDLAKWIWYCSSQGLGGRSLCTLCAAAQQKFPFRKLYKESDCTVCWERRTHCQDIWHDLRSVKDAILSLFLVILHSFFSQWYKVLKRELEVKTDFNSHSARKAQRNCGCSIRFQLLLVIPAFSWCENRYTDKLRFVRRVCLC